MIGFRFSIRGLITIVAVVALAFGWWADHRRMDSRVIEWASECNKLDQKMWQYHKFRAAWTTSVLTTAQSNPPSPEVAAEVIDTVRNDPDFSIKVRAMAILPFLREREQAVDALIEATKDREDESSGSGNVPLYAGTYLAEMKATRAIDALADWVAYIKKQWPYETERDAVLKKSQQDLDDLKAAMPPTKESEGR
jgi:hypothetical protein